METTKEIPNKKIILVDDHEFFRIGLKMVLGRFYYAKVVGEASNGAELLELIRTVEADIVFMDINMPVMDGIEATKQALQVKPDLRIICMTSLNDQFEEMINAGACGILGKDMKVDKLEYALQQIISGKDFYSPDVVNYMMKLGKFNKDLPEFTERELEVLRLVAEGYNSNQIAEKLNISHRTVTNHRANMHKKAETTSMIGLLSFAMKHKLISKIL